MFDPEAAPRSPAIAAALGPLRAALALTEGLTPGPRRLLVACSGGADSLAALGLLLILRRSEGLELGVGHVDHGLRPESGAEAEAVDALARSLGLPSFHTKLTLAGGPGLPARARLARRAALRDQAERFAAPIIVLAHTATDQAETMLMHLTRGAGLDGLAAMAILDDDQANQASSKPRWLRPVLNLTRAQTRGIALELGLPILDDPSNEDMGTLRVRLRKAVLPVLRAHNPRIERALVSLAQQAADADEACERWAADEEHARRQGLAEPEADVLGRWDLAGFHALPRAVRTRALRRMCEFGAVDLTQLRARIVEAMDAAAVAVARANALGAASPSPAPRSWDLRPRRSLTIDKHGLRARQTAK